MGEVQNTESFFAPAKPSRFARYFATILEELVGWFLRLRPQGMLVCCFPSSLVVHREEPDTFFVPVALPKGGRG